MFLYCTLPEGRIDNDGSMMAAGEAQRVCRIEEHRAASGGPVKKKIAFKDPPLQDYG